MQRTVIEAVRAFLASPDGEAGFLGRACHVTVGFDDADLVPLR